MKKIITFLCVVIMTFSLAACGGSSNASTPTEEATPVAAVSTPEPEPVKAPEPKEEKEPEPSPQDEAKQNILEYVDLAYIGLTPAKAPMYFMVGEEGKYVALVLEHTDGESYVKFIGSSEIDDESGILTVTDSDNGYMFGFSAEEQEDGSFFLDCGNLGEAYLESAEPEDVVDSIFTAFQNMEDITDSFMEEAATMNIQDSIDLAYSGQTAAGGWMYYLASSDDSFAALVMENENETGYIKFVGSTVFDEESGIQTVIDSQRDYTFNFIAEETEDGSYFLDCGELGECYLEPDEIDAVMGYIETTFEDMEDVTDEFMAAYGH